MAEDGYIPCNRCFQRGLETCNVQQIAPDEQCNNCLGAHFKNNECTRRLNHKSRKTKSAPASTTPSAPDHAVNSTEATSTATANDLALIQQPQDHRTAQLRAEVAEANDRLFAFQVNSLYVRHQYEELEQDVWEYQQATMQAQAERDDAQARLAQANQRNAVLEQQIITLINTNSTLANQVSRGYA